MKQDFYSAYPEMKEEISYVRVDSYTWDRIVAVIETVRACKSEDYMIGSPIVKAFEALEEA